MNKANLTAYEVVTEENLTDIHSTGWLLRHKKTGARVMLIKGISIKGSFRRTGKGFSEYVPECYDLSG